MTSIEHRAIRWLLSDDTGSSSQAICAHFTGNAMPVMMAPSDPGDLGRCLRLLSVIPEWSPRISEMARYSAAWEGIVTVWGRLAELMDYEVGIDWSKGGKAPRTYEAMKAATDHTMVWRRNANGERLFGFPNEDVIADHARRYGGADS